MEKLSFFKRLRLFREYWILMNRNKDIITNVNNGLNLRVDKLKRMFTVINCPDDVSRYGLSLAQRHINEYVREMEKLTIELNMYEYITTRRIVQVSETSFLIVFDFKGFDVAKLIRQTIFSLFTIGAAIGIYFTFF